VQQRTETLNKGFACCGHRDTGAGLHQKRKTQRRFQNSPINGKHSRSNHVLLLAVPAGQMHGAAKLLQQLHLFVLSQLPTERRLFFLDLREDTVAKFLDNVVPLRPRKRELYCLQVTIDQFHNVLQKDTLQNEVLQT